MHIPVLLQEVIQFLEPRPGKIFIDGTLGLGGHARALLEKISPDGKLIGFEQDPRNASLARRHLSDFKQMLTVIESNFENMQTELSARHISGVDGILFDLGISSLHLDEAERGFSFRHDGPLDMRMNPNADIPTAGEILKYSSPEELTHIFRTYGEEPRARLFAHSIVKRRTLQPFTTTHDLADFISTLSPKTKRTQGGHPATLVFQSLRIAVNKELTVLENVLPQALELLKPGGKIVIISFHSLEDRIVKNFFKQYSTRSKNQKYPQFEAGISPEKPLHILTKTPLTPSAQEREENPRARSARLRAAEKIL